jgi:uncharacterized protein (DUF1810 family)
MGADHAPTSPSAPADPSAPSDPFRLQRFVDAQDGVYERALRELRAGRKRTHWIWFVFPQLVGLGSSAMAQEYGISSREEAVAYLHHPLLGPRLVECVEAVVAVAGEGRSVEDIVGPDAVKLRSSLTLFAEAEPDVTVFRDALGQCFGGRTDRRTLELLAARGPTRSA